MPNSSKSGARYFIDGFKLISQPGLRVFVVVPLIVNILLFSVGFYFAIIQLQELFTWLDTRLPEYLGWLNFVLWPLAIMAMLVIMAFIFSSVMNWLAAPFNGLLAEKVEIILTAQVIDTASNWDMVTDLPRVLKREWIKLKYYLPRAIVFFLLFFVPIAGQLLAPLLWFLFSAWMMAIQYCDYPFDNHKIPFDDMKTKLRENAGASLSFGAIVTIFSMIPIVNFIVMPVAICGATSMWVDKYRIQCQ